MLPICNGYSCYSLLLQNELVVKDPDLLKLGLLYEVGVDAATVQEPETLLSFQHKSLQEFAGSKHLAKRLDNIMKAGEDVKVNISLYLVIIVIIVIIIMLYEIFPSSEDVKKHEEVVVFSYGLMDSPEPLVDHVYEIFREREITWV